MRKKKQTSVALERAATRAAAISTIDPVLDFGNGLTLEAYRSAMVDTREKLATYNQLLSQVDAALTRLSQSEEELTGWSRRMLSGVLARYGSDSVEYKKAGGTRKSERRRPKSATAGATTTKALAAA